MIILDNVLEDDCFKETKEDFLDYIDQSTPEIWYLLGSNHYYRDFCYCLMNLANTYFSLKDCTGYEFWIHKDTKPPTWHIDNDERRRQEDNLMSFPLCSIIYYLNVQNLIDGKLNVSHDESITPGSTNDDYERTRSKLKKDPGTNDVIVPKENRMVILPPGKFHNVNSFIGKRLSIVINPWIAEKYKYPHIVNERFV